MEHILTFNIKIFGVLCFREQLPFKCPYMITTSIKHGLFRILSSSLSAPWAPATVALISLFVALGLLKQAYK